MNRMPGRVIATLCVFFLAGSTGAYSASWMSDVVAKQNCIDSLGSVVSSERTCKTWTRREGGTPLYDETYARIIVGGSDNYLHIVRPKDGKVTKRIPLLGSLLASAELDKRDGLILFATDKGVAYAFERKDLNVVWQTNLDSGVLETVTLHEGKVLVVTKLGTLYALSSETGKVEWFKKRELPNRVFLKNMSTPVAFATQKSGSEKELLAVGNPDGRLEFIDPSDGELVEQMQLDKKGEPFGDVAATPVVNDRYLFAASFNRGLVAINKRTRVRRWELNEKGIAQLATASGIVVASGAKFVIGVNSENGKILW